MGIYRDITEQKEMERGLLDANYEMANMAVTDDLTAYTMSVISDKG